MGSWRGSLHRSLHFHIQSIFFTRILFLIRCSCGQRGHPSPAALLAGTRFFRSGGVRSEGILLPRLSVFTNLGVPGGRLTIQLLTPKSESPLCPLLPRPPQLASQAKERPPQDRETSLTSRSDMGVLSSSGRCCSRARTMQFAMMVAKIIYSKGVRRN